MIQGTCVCACAIQVSARDTEITLKYEHNSGDNAKRSHSKSTMTRRNAYNTRARRLFHAR
eukprot:m.391672 g.391672  ORF g.391672 m.391672 type:complete len:60 (+) comp218416_c0_seq1:71-250(+)